MINHTGLSHFSLRWCSAPTSALVMWISSSHKTIQTSQVNSGLITEVSFASLMKLMFLFLLSRRLLSESSETALVSLTGAVNILKALRGDVSIHEKIRLFLRSVPSWSKQGAFGQYTAAVCQQSLALSILTALCWLDTRSEGRIYQAKWESKKDLAHY